MKHTNRQTTTRTLTDLFRAIDRQHAITLTYRKEDGTETVRTIEVYDLRTTAAGDIVIKAMDRETQESRTFRLDRIETYTLSRSAFQVQRPTEDTLAAAPFNPRTPNQLIAYEIARDERTNLATRYAQAA